MTATLEPCIQQPTDSPCGFLFDSLSERRELRVLPSHIETIHQRITAVGCAPEALRKVAGIVPATIGRLCLVFEIGIAILMAHVVDARHRKAASLAEIEVQCREQGLQPNILTDGERFRLIVAIAQSIGAWFVEGREVE